MLQEHPHSDWEQIKIVPLILEADILKLLKGLVLLCTWSNFYFLLSSICWNIKCILHQAYAWGFDIRSWQRHLNPITWPEILRQFALAAGFGPKLEKRSAEQTFIRDEIEV